VAKYKLIILFFLISITSVSPLLLKPNYDESIPSFNSNGLSNVALTTNNYEQFVNTNIPFTNDYLPLLDDEYSDYELIASNSNLELFVNRRDLSIIIHNRITDYYWGSTVNVDYNDLDDDYNPLYPELYNSEDDGFVSNNVKRRVRSAIAIEYTSKSSTSIRFDSDNLLSAGSKISFKRNPGFKGFSADIQFGLSKIKLTLEVELLNDRLDIRIPYDKIIEDETFLLGRVIVYQYFGAVYLDKIPGYYFIPDGSGALVRFRDIKNSESYSKRFYNTDIGISSVYRTPQTGYQEGDILANTYGIVHGENKDAVQVIITSGDYYSTLKIDPARTTSYFWNIYPYFIFRNSYTQYLNASHSLSITQLQDNAIPFDINMQYIFLSNEDANYVGFANTYRDYLLKGNKIIDHNLSPNIKINIDSIGLVYKDLGMFNSPVVMTSIKELENIIDDLKDNGVKDYIATYSGWSKGGAGEGPVYKSLSSKLGTKKEFINFNKNYNVYLVEHAGFTNGDYKLKNSEKIYSLNHMPQESSDFGVMTAKKSAELIKSNYNRIQKKYGDVSFLISGLSQTYFTNFYNNKIETRDSFDTAYSTLLHELSGIVPYYAYANLWFSEDLFQMPVHSSNIGIYTDTIPFVQIVLSGYSNLYGDQLNYYSNPKTEVLRLIDYNVMPSVMLTNESSYLFKDTGYEYIFTSKYSDWKDEVTYIYDYINDALSSVRDKTIIKREVLGVGVYKTTYSNNKIIIVNFSDKDFNNGVYSVVKSGYKVY
jgi:hypothetical protein